MDKLDDYTFNRVLSFTYDMGEYKTYAKILCQFGTQNKHFVKWTRRREFLETFYYNMFTSIIKADSLHIVTTCVPEDKRHYKDVDSNGYFLNKYHNYDTWYRCGGKCRNPSHYDMGDKRARESRYKNLFVHCRNKYILMELKANNFTKTQGDKLFALERKRDRLITECDNANEKKRKFERLASLKEKYKKHINKN